jgi:Ca2+-binding EF-hand superfamily protein
MKKLWIIGVGLSFALVMKSQNIETNFEAWDGNKDGRIDLKEYSLNVQLFESWDQNNDNRISKSEFAESYFALLDINFDGRIDNDELQQVGFMLSFADTHETHSEQTGDMKTGQSGMKHHEDEMIGEGQEEMPMHDHMHSDMAGEDTVMQGMRMGAGIGLGELGSEDDEFVSENAFANSEFVENTFSAWDENNDNYLSKAEFYKNTFRWWDVDSDGYLSEGEFARMISILDRETEDNLIF